MLNRSLVGRCKFLLALLLSLSWADGVLAVALPEIEYVAPEQSVWTTRLDSHGQPDNPMFRVAAQLFGKAGIAWHGKSYPAVRMFKYLQDGSAQFSILVKAPSLEECCLFSKKPLAAAEIRVYHQAGKAPLLRREDLSGKKIITVAGYSYGGLLPFLADAQNHIGNQVAPTHLAAFRMLSNGRADYVIDYSGPAGEILAQEPIADIHSELLSRQEVFLVLSRSYPDAAKVMKRLETIAEQLDIEKIIRSAAR